MLRDSSLDTVGGDEADNLKNGHVSKRDGRWRTVAGRAHPVCDSLNVFLLVVLAYNDFSTSRFEIDRDHLSESFLGGGEGVIDNVGDVVFPVNAASRNAPINCLIKTISSAPRYSQHPSQTPVQLYIHTLQIRQRDFLVQNHLVETDDEISIQESSVEDTKPKHSADEFEVIQVFGVDARVGVDLKSIVVVSRVLEKAVEGVEHLVREEEEEFSVKSGFEWMSMMLPRSTAP